MLRVYMPSPWPPDLADRVATMAPQHGRDVHVSTDVDDAHNADVLVSGRPDPGIIDRMPRLRGVVVPFAGIPGRTRDLLAGRPELALWNLHHNAPAVAEHVVAMLLAVTRRIVPGHTNLQQGNWTDRHDGPRSRALRGRHAVIVGYGRIGRALAPMLGGLGMRVTGVRRCRGGTLDGIPTVAVQALDAVLADADVVVLALPSTDATRGLFDAARLARVPSGAILINVGRADAVVEDALADALHRGHLGGAALDVWWSYPDDVDAQADTAPCSERLRSAPGLLMSPHRAGHDDVAEHERAAALARLLAAIAAGDADAWRVDVARGY